MAPRTAVIIFVRAPELGKVKTRLAADVGAEAALRLYKRMGKHAVDTALRLGPDAKVQIHYTPQGTVLRVGGWLERPRDVSYTPQEGDDLGDRLWTACRVAFDDGFERVLVVGSDLPALTTELLREAIQRLDSSDVVIGPSLDGGYYLIGMRRLVRGVFCLIPWSTDRVLEVTRERLREEKVEPVLLETLNDVDTAADLPDGWLVDDLPRK